MFWDLNFIARSNYFKIITKNVMSYHQVIEVSIFRTLLKELKMFYLFIQLFKI